MKFLHKIVYAVLFGLCLGNLLACCCLYIDETIPKYKGVPVEAKPIVDRFLGTANFMGIKFNHTVSVGFGNLKSPIIGVCEFRQAYREITLDKDFWLTSTAMSKEALLLHELAHCYCGRMHDFGKDKPYPEAGLGGDRKNETTFVWVNIFKPEGYYDDGCPLSLMHPYLPDDSCSHRHYADYVKEIYDRCEPY